jgi:hypothetical protein
MRMAVAATWAEADIFEPFVVNAFFEGVYNILVADAAGFQLIIPMYPALVIRSPQYTDVRFLFVTVKRITTMTFFTADTFWLMCRVFPFDEKIADVQWVGNTRMASNAIVLFVICLD